MRHPRTVVLLCLTAILTMPLLAHGQDTSPRNESATAPRNAPLNIFDPAVLNNLAVAKARRGELAEAVALLERAARLTPKYPEVEHNRERLGEWIELSGLRIESASDQASGVALRSGATLGAPPALWALPESR